MAVAESEAFYPASDVTLRANADRSVTLVVARKAAADAADRLTLTDLERRPVTGQVGSVQNIR